jgi:pSer/pThr/pTyr-binding forkhead associated (FHA) protein
MQVVLVMFRGEGERRSFSIARDITIIGRREDCDFRIPLGEISRKHCRLMKEGESLKVEDLGSSNGTYHNGERVQSASLGPGDTLQVGSVAFVVQIDGVPAEDELHPVTAGSRRTTAPAAGREDVTLSDDSAASDTPVEAAPAKSRGNGHSHDSASGNGEFDPMTILEAEGSGALPAIDDSSSASSEAMMIDIAGQSHAGDNLNADRA